MTQEEVDMYVNYTAKMQADHLKHIMGPSRAEKMEELYSEIKDIPVEELLQEFQKVVFPAIKRAFEGDAELAGFNFDGFG